MTVPQLLALALCGISNAGGDVGGFIGDPEPELAVRWYQLGAFMPYFRGHSANSSKRREPWLYERKYMDLIKESIKERYRLLPYWYTSFEEHSRTGIPLLKPVWFGLEENIDEGNMHDQERFMVGDGLLVFPITDKGRTSIYFPLRALEGRWYDYYTKKEFSSADKKIRTGLERIGCFVKGGHVIPTFDIKQDVKSSKDAKESDIVLYVALDEKNQAEGNVYFDDGETFDYKKGIKALKKIKFVDNALSWEGEEEDKYVISNKITKVVIMGLEADKFQNAYLRDEENNIERALLKNDADSIFVEFAASASKNWKMILE